VFRHLGDMCFANVVEVVHPIVKQGNVHANARQFGHRHIHVAQRKLQLCRKLQHRSSTYHSGFRLLCTDVGSRKSIRMYTVVHT